MVRLGSRRQRWGSSIVVMFVASALAFMLLVDVCWAATDQGTMASAATTSSNTTHSSGSGSSGSVQATGARSATTVANVNRDAVTTGGATGGTTAATMFSSNTTSANNTGRAGATSGASGSAGQNGSNQAATASGSTLAAGGPSGKTIAENHQAANNLASSTADANTGNASSQAVSGDLTVANGGAGSATTDAATGKQDSSTSSSATITTSAITNGTAASTTGNALSEGQAGSNQASASVVNVHAAGGAHSSQGLGKTSAVNDQAASIDARSTAQASTGNSSSQGVQITAVLINGGGTSITGASGSDPVRDNRLESDGSANDISGAAQATGQRGSNAASASSVGVGAAGGATADDTASGPALDQAVKAHNAQAVRMTDTTLAQATSGVASGHGIASITATILNAGFDTQRNGGTGNDSNTFINIGGATNITGVASASGRIGDDSGTATAGEAVAAGGAIVAAAPTAARRSAGALTNASIEQLISGDNTAAAIAETGSAVGDGISSASLIIINGGGFDNTDNGGTRQNGNSDISASLKDTNYITNQGSIVDLSGSAAALGQAGGNNDSTLAIGAAAAGPSSLASHDIAQASSWTAAAARQKVVQTTLEQAAAFSGDTAGVGIASTSTSIVNGVGISADIETGGALNSAFSSVNATAINTSTVQNTGAALSASGVVVATGRAGVNNADLVAGNAAAAGGSEIHASADSKASERSATSSIEQSAALNSVDAAAGRSGTATASGIDGAETTLVHLAPTPIDTGGATRQQERAVLYVVQNVDTVASSGTAIAISGNNVVAGSTADHVLHSLAGATGASSGASSR